MTTRQKEQVAVLYKCKSRTFGQFDAFNFQRMKNKALVAVAVSISSFVADRELFFERFERPLLNVN